MEKGASAKYTSYNQLYGQINKVCCSVQVPTQTPNPSCRKKNHIEDAAIIEMGNNKVVDKRLSSRKTC